MNHETAESELPVGVRLLDCDHREMAETILELQTGTELAKDQSRGSRLLRKLAHFSLTHFALEEAMMAATKYPRLAMHQLLHQKMMEQFRQAILVQNRGKQPLCADWLRAVSNWHVLHVKDADGHYGHWLNGTRKR